MLKLQNAPDLIVDCMKIKLKGLEEIFEINNKKSNPNDFHGMSRYYFINWYEDYKDYKMTVNVGSLDFPNVSFYFCSMFIPVSWLEKVIEIEVTLDNGFKKLIDKESLHICPDCNDRSVRVKELCEGGGVKCINKDCNYWFCF